MEGDITHVQKIIGKIFLNYIAFVAAADYKIIDSVGTEDLEDVPKDRLAADFHHRFGLEMGFFANPSTKTTRQNDCFHYVKILEQ